MIAKPGGLRVVGGVLVLTGIASLIPVMAYRVEQGAFSRGALAVIAVSAVIMACGVAALVRSSKSQSGPWGLGPLGPVLPRSVRIVITANALVLAFLGLELSDRVVRQDGNLHYWTTWLLLPAILLLAGLVAARRWSWWVARGTTGIGVIWFVGFLLVIPFAPLSSDGTPAPWYGRVYAATVTLLFAAVMIGAFRALGRTEARTWFGIR